MAFVRFDDGWADHPKLVQAGPLAAHLYAVGISYANRHLTDGYLPAAVLDRLVGWTGITEAGEQVTNHALAERLVQHGLWHHADGGYTIHDYLDHQPTRREIEQRRREVSQARSKAGRAGGKSTAAKRQQTDSKRAANAQQTDSTAQVANAQPHPIPSQRGVSDKRTPSRARDLTEPSTVAGRKEARTRRRLGLAALPAPGGDQA